MRPLPLVGWLLVTFLLGAVATIITLQFVTADDRALLDGIEPAADSGGEQPIVVIDSRRPFEVQFDHDRKTAWISLPHRATVWIAINAYTEGRATPRFDDCEPAGGFTYGVPGFTACFIRIEMEAHLPYGFRVSHPISKLEIWE